MKIYVVGIGPGEACQMTERAQQAIEKSSVLVGYEVYINLIRDRYPDKRVLTTPMTRELERCRLCFQEARMGNTVSMICGGDAGVYGMAGPICELSAEYPDVEIEVVPGITAALSGAAVLGAPLIHDFAVISLSDLLTEWTLIERRLDAAAMADFVLCLYNPSSRRRHDFLQQACDIVLRHRSGETVTGIVRNIGREGQQARIMTLSELRNTQVDMFTTVFIGNSTTKTIHGRMVTPRGYRHGLD